MENNIEQVIDEIQTRRRDKLHRKKKGPFPKSNPTASDISDCQRETVLGVTHWQDRPPFSDDLMERLERGDKIEDWIMLELAELGYRVSRERYPFEIKDKKGRITARGKVDGYLEIEPKGPPVFVKGSIDKTEMTALSMPGTVVEVNVEMPMPVKRTPMIIPIECKSMTPAMFAKIDTQEDFERYIFFRKYPRQLQLYLYANNLEVGMWIIDDCLGHWKLIPCRLDYEKVEKILQQLEGAVEHIAAGTLPDYHKDAQVCLKCWAFKRVCTPPIAQANGEGPQFLDDPDFALKLERHQQLDPAASEYDSLDREIKGTLKKIMRDGQTFIIGDYMVSADEKTRNMKAKEAHTQKFLQFEIEKMP